MKNRIQKLIKRLSEANDKFLGYPCNADFDYSELYPLLRFEVNNVGDPFDKQGTYVTNTKDFELEVIEFFQKILKGNSKDTWGYVTTGGTEGNHYGLYIAREKFKGATVYYSDQTHYSVPKIIKMLNMKSVVVKSQFNGEIDYNELRDKIELKKEPVIVFANIGTTMKGAVDNIYKIKQICNGYDHYIHADAALAGMMLPFCKYPQPHTFEDGIDSISISGHKFIGSPLPCGIVLTKSKYVKMVTADIEYIRGKDTTMTGSRSGITPMILWYSINKNGIEGYTKQVEKCFKMADYAINKFKEYGITAWRNENSNTVVFPSKNVDPKLFQKWQIATEGKIGHLITMQHVTTNMIDSFIFDVYKEKNDI